jgi:DUF4097 and DUF4098 domain-containing protein YvlB
MMSKKEYLSLLKEKLSFADESFVESLIADFEAHFEAGLVEGLTEDEIISHLGDINEIVESMDKDVVFKEKDERKAQSSSENVNHVVVDAKFADVTFVPSQNGKIEVNMINKGGLLSKFTNTMIGEQKGDVFEVRVLPLFNVSSNVDMKISVTLPSKLLTCKVMSSSGDIEYSNIVFDGECFIKSASGDISVSDCVHKKFDIQAASSDVHFTRNTGDVSIKLASGDVTIEEGRGVSLECTSASGDVQIDGAYQKIKAKSVSGDLDLVLSGAQECTIASVNGDGKVSFNDMDSIRFDFVAVSGHCMIDEPNGKHKLKNNQHLVINEGKIPVHINTVSGEFEVNMG